ncbi:MAG: EAL domain-containing protein [Oricola sp.]
MAEMLPLQIERRDNGSFMARYGDFVLQTAFQPVFRFEKGRLVPIACEALLRVSRNDVPVLTDAFFATLDPAAFRALEPQLRVLHVRNARNLPAGQRRLFLNFDPRTASELASFESGLRQLGTELLETGISPADVVCEITEAETGSNEALKRFAWELRARGYLLAVDDFGAHASRMQRVRSLAPDIVKFDGALVKRLMSTDAGVGTLRLLVERFARDGIHSVLEGLEELWEISLAESTGAAMVQGYVLAAPRLAGPDLAAWIAQYRPAPERRGERLVKTFR